MKKILIATFIGLFSFTFAQREYYDDYRSSINGINWGDVVSELLLNTSQKNQLFSLNNQYSDYNSWDRVYRNNPDRWRNDRFGAIERILGADKYKKFKNKYYKGQNPVAVYNRNKNNHKPYSNSANNGNNNHRGNQSHKAVKGKGKKSR